DQEATLDPADRIAATADEQDAEALRYGTLVVLRDRAVGCGKGHAGPGASAIRLTMAAAEAFHPAGEPLMRHEDRAVGHSDVEAQGAQLLAAVVGDLVRPPRRHPNPVDPEVVHDALQAHPGLVLDHILQRAGRR